LEKPERVVEAALFSAGRPVSVEEIGEATGLDPETIRTTIRKLIRSSRNRDTSLEVVKAGAKYAMQLKKELVPAAAKLAQMDIPRRLLKTLALIAYHQPVKQSEVLEMVGAKVYDHVHELHKLGLILESPEGQTKILTTSSRFPEYFGIKTTKREDIKKWMAERVGIKVDGTSVGAQPAPEILTDKATAPMTGEAAMTKEAQPGEEEAGPAGEEVKPPVKKEGKGPDEEE
jgi:segregation and condensation protein B